MKINEFDTPQGALQYRIMDNQAEIIAYRGKDVEVTIPEQIESCPVTRIGKKAFLSNKMIKQITLPESIVRIDDWAFAYCAKLTRMILPYHKMEIGQGIFKECGRLDQIIDEQGDMTGKRTMDIACLLAATMSRLDAFYLFDFENAGTDGWLVQWDARMQYLMSLDDTEGFSKMLLCGEEDYGSKENNLDYYIQQQRKSKVRLAMLRLMHDYGLSEPASNRLKEYLLAHNKGQPTEETWRVVLEEHGDEKEYFQFLIDLGCVTLENFQDLIADMGDSHTEMKAFLMRYHSNQSESQDAFAAFSL
ncbi:MAG: leucine-rich repeat protein [Lachnospiraceae bacterium]|nr:leucine-rich repeat protein [Lachnospiraceae bacterium]